MKIPLTKPYWGKEEEIAAVSALRETSGVGDGSNTAKAVALLKKLTGASHALPVTSCTHGMELALSAMELAPGDEVILPSFTMSSTANAVLVNGARPVFADIEPDNFSIAPDDIERKITAKTRGIMVVHYAGMPARMEKLRKTAKKHKLFIIEDAAHCIDSYYHDVMLGTWGDAGVFSFHGTKNISCGEGGAVVTNHKKFADKMEIYRANGTNRKQFLEGIVDKYSWVGPGSSYFLSDILSAILVAQLKKVTAITRHRQRIARQYLDALAPYADRIILPTVPEGTKPNWHIFAIRLRNPALRPAFIAHMRTHGVEVSYHYIPLHSAPMGNKIYRGTPPHLPVTDNIAASLVRLPIYAGMTESQAEYVLKWVKKALDTQ